VSRFPVSVVVTASGSTDEFRACLHSLQPTVGRRDEVVCVVPGDRADLRTELRNHTWIQGIDEGPADPAGRWATGLAATTHPVVVLLDGDVVLSTGWLDAVAAPFAEPDVVAAGPRCHRSYGPQKVELPAEAISGLASFRAYARAWRQENRHRVTAVDRLGPVCVAVRRDALSAAGGPAGDLPDLPYERLRDRGRLVLVQSALIAHVGGDRCSLRGTAAAGDRPLLSASMIVKDEEEVLADSLAALAEFVDEIVVYDTGSTDRTVEIARQHGARVVEGYWTDHFAEARNRSIAECRGRWIFVVDADEVTAGEPAALRERLTAGAAPAYLMNVNSLEGRGQEGPGVLSVRIFPRDAACYYGRLHEFVADRVTGEAVTGEAVSEAELYHSGYTISRFAAKQKGERNVRLAALAADDDSNERREEAAVDLARSHLFAGEVDAAIDVCRAGLAAGPSRYARGLLLGVLSSASLAAGRFADAEEALDSLREISDSPLTPDYLEARLRYAVGDYERALALIEAFPEKVVNDHRLIVGRRQLADVEIASLHHLDRHPEAAARLRECLERGELPLGIPQLARVLEADGTGVAALATLAPRRSLRPLLLAAGEAPDALADDLFEALWQEYSGEPVILASAARIGARLPLMRALEWSARLRQHGFAPHCTLIALAGNGDRTPRERSLAAAIAVEMYGDGTAMPLLADALGQVPAEEAAGLLAEMGLLAPDVAAAIEPAPAT
jgi:GT2 family glycosyltransferase